MVAVELERATPWQDRRRRQRIAAGNLQQALRLRRLLRPRHRGIALTFASGKALRAIMPFLLVASLGGSLALAPSSALFAAAAAGQVVLYGLALLRHMTPEVSWPRPIESVHYLVSGHIAGLIGATRYLLGAEGRGWSGAAHKRASGDAAIGVPRLGLWRLHCLPHVHPVVAVAKRAGDVGAAALMLLFVAPLFPLIALAIRLDSPGPVFFRQLRVGESLPDRTRLFQIIKFRTMRIDGAPAPKAKWASDNDPRITRVGRLLRKTRLDELPQLINVLRGEMSLIGPRPEQPGILPWLEANIPYYGERLYGVRPGITGFAQVYQGYDHTLDDVRAKLNYDHAYAMALSRPSAWLALELHIIGRTLRVMATAAGH
jgi:lipopolysaccharide/colanic/teichoic acid biosynthesis glycosyltransferase